MFTVEVMHKVSSIHEPHVAYSKVTAYRTYAYVLMLKQLRGSYTYSQLSAYPPPDKEIIRGWYKMMRKGQTISVGRFEHTIREW